MSSIQIYPYLADPAKVFPQSAPTVSMRAETEAASFKEALAKADRTRQAIAVDALIAVAGGVTVETIQRLLGFSPVTTGSAANTGNAGRTEEPAAAGSSPDASALSCSAELEAYFEEAAETYGVDINLLKAVAKAESGFNPNATSTAGAMGIMQLMPSTAESLGVENAYDACDNIMGGAKLLSQLLDKYDGDVSLALAAYNAGSGNVDKYGGIPPFAETQNYVKKVTEYYKNAQG